MEILLAEARQLVAASQMESPEVFRHPIVGSLSAVVPRLAAAQASAQAAALQLT